MRRDPSEAAPRGFGRSRRRPLVSLTPLIDVVFILLVFFMLASSFTDWRAIRLDAARAGAGVQTAEGAVLIGVSADGVTLGGRPIDAAALGAHVAGRPEARFLLRPAPATPLQATVDALDLLREAGAAQVALIAPHGG